MLNEVRIYGQLKIDPRRYRCIPSCWCLQIYDDGTVLANYDNVRRAEERASRIS